MVRARHSAASFPGLLRTTFSADAKLPADATDTGWGRDGRQLWIAADGEAAYLVSAMRRTSSAGRRPRSPFAARDG